MTTKDAKDPNTIIQSLIETARAVWKSIAPGGSREITAAALLLERVEPQGQKATPWDRLATWAAKNGHTVKVDATAPGEDAPDPSGKKPPAPPVPLIRLTINRPA